MITPVTLDQISQDFWKILIYGPPGVGKSTMGAGSKKYRTLIVDVDVGINSAKANRIKLGLPLDMVTVIQIKTSAEHKEAVSYLISNLNGPVQKRFGLMVLDTFTELHQMIETEIGRRFSHEILDQRDWGLVRKNSTEITEYYKHLPINVLYLGHEINKIDSNLGREVWRPSMDGRYAFEYAKHMDVMGRANMVFVAGPKDENGKPTQQLVRAIDFGPSPYHHYKDRSGILSRMEPMDIDYIIDKCNWAVKQQPIEIEGV